jgi:hypothetical protein
MAGQTKGASHKRVLWLLNHRTLNEYEPNLLVRLGFEVFTPKIIPPAKRFRSGAITHQFDQTLTIPNGALKVLNETDFYEAPWSPRVVEIMNRYFGSAFIIPYGVHVHEALKKYEGQILFRAFGLEAKRTYSQVLEEMYGTRILLEIESLGERFWFAEGYRQLAEIEHPALRSRELFLPIGLPQSFWAHANTYRGTSKQILFVCPQIKTNRHYAEQYQHFKAHFGDLPHVIVGAQDEPVGDPCVRGFVTDEQLIALYQESAALLYPSREPRHIHYSPIEAVIVGTPIVFFDDSLLSRLSPEVRAGRVQDEIGARKIMESLIAADPLFVDSFRREQNELPRVFKDDHCLESWRTEIIDSGFGGSLRIEANRRRMWREAKRTICRPILRGRTSLYRVPQFPGGIDFLHLSNAERKCGSLCAGLDLQAEKFPDFLIAYSGLSWPEDRGRWTSGKEATLVLNHTFPRSFLLELAGFSHPKYSNRKTSIVIGSQKRNFKISSVREDRVLMYFDQGRKTNIMRFKIRDPIRVGSDDRELALFLTSLKISDITTNEAKCRWLVPSWRSFYWKRIRRTIENQKGFLVRPFSDLAPGELSEATLCSGIDFSEEEIPEFLVEHTGLSWPEKHGRWTSGEQVELVLNHTLPRCFIFNIEGFAHESNEQESIKVKFGRITRTLKFDGPDAGFQVRSVEVSVPKHCNVIRISLPNPTILPDDDRGISLAIRRIWIEPKP